MTVTPDPQQAEAAVAIATLTQRKDAAAQLKKRPRSLTRVLKMTARALARADDAIAQVLKLRPAERPIQCQAGCPWCCHIRVTVSAPELLLILKHIGDFWSPDDIAALKIKVKNLDLVTRGKSNEERSAQRLPCALLKDGSCAVHEVRPLSCRGLLSADREACKRAFDQRMEGEVPQHELAALAANGVGYGLYAGMADAGFAPENIELNAGLAIGLADKDAGKRWLGREKVFAGAVGVVVG